MRTTVTLDPDTEHLLRRRMSEKGVSFKRALNDAIRAGLAGREQAPYETPTFDMGVPTVDLTKALRIAGELEDEHLLASPQARRVTLVDANVLLNAVNRSAPDHAVAKRWLDAALSGATPVGFAWVVLLAVLRLATRPGLFPRPLTADEATTLVRGWLSAPSSVVLHPGSRHLDLLASMLTDAGTAGNLTTDAHLAALAREHNATVISFDADFARFTGLHWARPE